MVTVSIMSRRSNAVGRIHVCGGSTGSTWFYEINDGDTCVSTMRLGLLDAAERCAAHSQYLMRAQLMEGSTALHAVLFTCMLTSIASMTS